MSGQKIISITCWVRILCYWSLALKAEALANGCFEGASTSVRISGDAKIVLRCAIWLKSRGRMAPPKRMNFRKSSKGGGGWSHFQSKNLYCRFWTFSFSPNSHWLLHHKKEDTGREDPGWPDGRMANEESPEKGWVCLIWRWGEQV